jgi:hypothetical protein
MIWNPCDSILHGFTEGARVVNGPSRACPLRFECCAITAKQGCRKRPATDMAH